MSALLPLALAAGLTLAASRGPRRGARNVGAPSVRVERRAFEMVVDGELVDPDGDPIDDATVLLRVGTPAEVKAWLRDEGSYFTGWRVPVRERNPDLVGFLEFVEVPERLRRGGWGRKLYEAAEELAHDEWLPEAIYLNAVPDAVGFWTRMGFRSVDDGKSGSTLVVMRKVLVQG